MELNNEIRAKAKAAKTPEELIEIAKENDVEMTEESAKAYFDLLHPQNGRDERRRAGQRVGRRLPRQRRPHGHHAYVRLRTLEMQKGRLKRAHGQSGILEAPEVSQVQMHSALQQLPVLHV